MDFTSIQFLFLFLPLFLPVYWIAKPQARLLLITIASLLLLVWNQPAALWVIGGLIVFAYLVGLGIKFTQEKHIRVAKFLFLFGIAGNILLLGFYKILTAYGTQWLDKLHLPIILSQDSASLVTPIGISFVTFQAIVYLIDVWRNKIDPEQNIVKLSAFFLFFPKFVSGPLMQYKAFSIQLSGLDPSIDDLANGLRRVLAGFIKRTLIANQLALVANAGFNLPTPNLTPGWAWLVLSAYTLQIYFDFSGYTDMAIGLGQMLGIRLPENFNYPYIAQSVGDFWRRWHMTLSTFFREYVFYPLERRRLPIAGQQINVLVVFLLTGLWHGVTPTFIVWGLLHGIAMALESAGLGRWLKSIWRPLRHIYTLTIVTFSWIFFRSSSLHFALGFIKRLAGSTSKLSVLPFSQTSPLPILEPSFIITLSLAIVFCLPLKQIWENLRSRQEKTSPASFFLWQTTEDIFLVLLVALGLALALSNSFMPNLYAKF